MLPWESEPTEITLNTKGGGKTALEENLLNKYSRKQEGNSTAPFLQLSLLANASYLVWLQIDWSKKTDYRKTQLLFIIHQPHSLSLSLSQLCMV